jgi:hypothetical protein
MKNKYRFIALILIVSGSCMGFAICVGHPILMIASMPIIVCIDAFTPKEWWYD